MSFCNRWFNIRQASFPGVSKFARFFPTIKTEAGKQAMKTGFRGTFVISWSQTEIDGLDAAPVQSLVVGAAWSWRGDAVRVDGPNDVLRLDVAEGAEQLRRRAARMVHRLVGTAMGGDTARIAQHDRRTDDDRHLTDNSFVVTDGAGRYTVTLIQVGRGSQPLLMFQDAMPPRDRDLWVVRHSLCTTPGPDKRGTGGGVICFTPGTMIRTPEGLAAIETLREGDLIQTKDSGARPIRWIGSRRMTGARMLVMPHLRPVRIRAGFMGAGLPRAGLLVSPEHRLLLKGRRAQELFGTPEVLVTARDLIDGASVAVDFKVREVSYIHVLLDHHQVLWANGLETESFHPASASLCALAEGDRQRLLDRYPDVAEDPHTYGGFARRKLTTSEAAILRHAA